MFPKFICIIHKAAAKENDNFVLDASERRRKFFARTQCFRHYVQVLSNICETNSWRKRMLQLGVPKGVTTQWCSEDINTDGHSENNYTYHRKWVGITR